MTEAEEFAYTHGFAPVTAESVMSALSAGSPISASEIAELLPRDHRGRKRSEYLVSWVLSELVRLRVVRRSRADAPMTYELANKLSMERPR